MVKRSALITFAIAAALGALMFAIERELLLPVVAGALGGGLSWAVGFTQGRRHGWHEAQHYHAVGMLQVAANHLERILAEAPEDLDGRDEELRQHLQRHYRETRELLSVAEPPPQPPRGVNGL